jgi:hypothetical protein
VLAWWTRHPQANIGLATGHQFDVLDIDGPAGADTIRAFAAEHQLASSGPLVRTGGGGWHYYLTPTGGGNNHPLDLEHVDWRGRGGYVVAPPSRHATGHPYQFVGGRDLNTPLAKVPAPLLERLQQRQLGRPATPSLPCRSATAQDLGMPRRRSPRSWAGSPPPPRANATSGCGKQPATSTTWSPAAPWTTARSTKACSKRPNAAGSSATNPARPTARWPPAVRSAWPTPARSPTAPAPTTPMLRRPRRPGRAASGPSRGGDAMTPGGDQAG